MKKLTPKKAFLILAIIGTIGIIIVAFMARKKSNVEYTIVTAVRSDLTQTVSETGTIKPFKELNLNFLTPGTISVNNVEVGDNVTKGQVLSELDYTELSFRKTQAIAQLRIAQANLAKLQEGATSQEIAVVEASVNQAKSSYESALKEKETNEKSLSDQITQAEKTYNDLIDSTSFSLTSVEQSVQTAKDNLDNTKKTNQKSIDDKISNSLSSVEAQNSSAKTALDSIKTILDNEDSKNLLSAKNKEFKINAETTYNEAIVKLANANKTLNNAKSNTTNTNVKSAFSDTINLLNKTFVALNSIFSALENTLTSSSFTQSELDAFKTTISTQISTVSASISAVQASEQALDSAILTYDSNVEAATNNLLQSQANYENSITTASNALTNAKNSKDQLLLLVESKIETSYKALQVSQAELIRIKSPARSQDITLAKATLNQAQSELSSINNKIEQSILKAPIDGKITDVNYEIGEQSSVAQPHISMIGENNFEVEVDISEADIAKVEVKDLVEITLDAFNEDDIYFGKVSFIEPAETIIQDVIYYRVKILFNNSEKLSKIKSGMTANVIITTANKANVIAIPTRALIDKNGDGTFVRLMIDNNVKEVKVSTGLFADGGQVEITNGINEQDKVITFIKEK